MIWSRIETDWYLMMGPVRQRWPLLTREDVHAIEGMKPRLINLVQQRYQLTWTEGERQVQTWADGLTSTTLTTDPTTRLHLRPIPYETPTAEPLAGPAVDSND